MQDDVGTIETAAQAAGRMLKAMREQAGLSVAALSAMTRIQRNYLEAMESGDFQALPGRFFISSFIRCVCKELAQAPDTTQLVIQLALSAGAASDKFAASAAGVDRAHRLSDVAGIVPQVSSSIPAVPRLKEVGPGGRLKFQGSLNRRAAVAAVAVCCLAAVAYFLKGKPLEWLKRGGGALTADSPAGEGTESPSQDPESVAPGPSDDDRADVMDEDNPGKTGLAAGEQAQESPDSGDGHATAESTDFKGTVATIQTGTPVLGPAVPSAGGGAPLVQDNAPGSRKPQATPSQAATQGVQPVQGIQVRNPKAVASELKIVAREKVEIKKKCDGSAFEKLTLEPGQHIYTFSQQCDLMIYDAGSVEVFFNQESLGTLGYKNRIRRLAFVHEALEGKPQ